MANSINKQAQAGLREQGINPDTMIPLSLRYGIVTVSLSFAILRYPSLPAQYAITGKVLNMRIKASKKIIRRPRMARITLPSYIKGGHGRMEDAVIVTRKGTTYMMIYKKRDGVLTQGQLAVRQAFSTVVADWKYLGGVIQMSWENMAGDSSATGYNEFIGENVQRRRAGEPLLLCPGMGAELLMNFTAAPGAAAGSIACSFLPPEQGYHVTFFPRRVTMPGVKAPVTRYDADAQSPFTITGLEPDAQYHVYAVVTDAAYEEASTVSASVAAVSAAG